MKLTTQEKEKRGQLIAEIFGLKKDKDFPGRYFSTWGNKTALGIYETTLRIIEKGE